MNYYIRTIPNLSNLLKPLDDVLTQFFIPAITEGHILSELDRKLISLPVRYGGLNIPIYQDLCVKEYEKSRKTSQILTNNIVNQENQYVHDFSKKI